MGTENELIQFDSPRNIRKHICLLKFKVSNKDIATTLMMLIMRIICLLKTLSRYIQLAEFFVLYALFNHMCSKFLKNIYMIWIISKDIYHFLAGFIWCQLFPGLFQIVPGWFQVVLDGFRSFRVVLVLVSTYRRPY